MLTMKLVALRVSVVVVIAASAHLVACAAPVEEEEGVDSPSALSDATCAPRAEAKKQAAIDECKKENPLLDWAACMAPAEKAWGEYEEQVAAALQPVKAEVDAITGACKAAVDALAADRLVSDAFPGMSDFAREEAQRNPKRLETLRAQRKLKCDEDAKSALRQRLGENDAYVELVDQRPRQALSWTGAYLSCGASGAVAWVKNESCTGLLAYQSEYASCRRQCSTLSEAACTPSSYGADEVPCGTLVNDRSVSWRVGRTCEETFQCERTSACDKYDKMKTQADRLNAAGSCEAGNGSSGILVPIIVKDTAGRATDVRIQCAKTDGASSAGP